MSFEETLVEVWRQIFVENGRTILLGIDQFPVVRTSKRKLRQVDFLYDGKEIRGLEQNPDTKSRWAALAKEGRKVMQFLSEGRYFAVVVDGQARMYGTRKNARG